MKDVQLVIDGNALATADENAPYQFAIDLAPGVYTLSAIATDLAGNAAESAAIDIGIDEAPPADDGGNGPGADSAEDEGGATDDGDDDEGDDDGGDDRGADATDPALPPGFGLDETAEGCGCATEPSSARSWLVAIALLLRRRRTGTAARC